MNRTIIKKLSYIGAAINEGQPNPGVKLGPQLIRNSGVFESLKKIHKVEQIKDHGDVSFESLSQEDRSRKPLTDYVRNIEKVDPLLKAISQKIQNVYKQREENQFVLNVGGDHSLGAASIHAALTQYPDIKVIWVDAHADFSHAFIKKTQNQNYHGMPLSHISGSNVLPGFEWMKHKIPFENIVLIGIRDIDEEEYVTLRENKVKCFTIDHVDKYGIGDVMTQALKYLDPQGNSPFHISFDVDGIDPYIVNQTGTVYRHGLSAREGCHIVKRVVNEKNLVSMDLVEINPDKGDVQSRPRFRDEEFLNPKLSQSVGMGVDLITSLMSQRLIL